MPSFQSIEDAYAERTRIIATTLRTVVAVVYFQHKSTHKLMKPVFLEKSEESEVQKYAKIKRDFIRVGAEIEGKQARDAAFALRKNTFKFASQFTLIRERHDLNPARHAEEKVVENFALYLAQCPDAERVYIMLTHSPCTIQDNAPSNNLAAQPDSCHLKLFTLAASHPTLTFCVDFLEPFGVFQGATDGALAHLAAGKPPNLIFSCITAGR